MRAQAARIPATRWTQNKHLATDLAVATLLKLTPSKVILEVLQFIDQGG
jgi:hypothetical protein